MSDRIYIMHEGAVVDEVKRGTDEFNSETIGARMMLGKREVEMMKTDVLKQSLKKVPPAAYMLIIIVNRVQYFRAALLLISFNL